MTSTAVEPQLDTLNMVGLQVLSDFVELCLWTGAVKGERPASAILVAPPGGGKSSLLESMACDTAPFATDLTSREIHTIMRDHPHATHILLSDMSAIFAHKRSVTALACSMLSSLTGDALRTDSFSGGTNGNGKRMGLITALPTADIGRRVVKMQLQTAGFGSRFMVLRYSYSMATQLRIHEYIKSDQYTRHQPREKLVIPNKPEYIDIPPKKADQLHLLAMAVRDESDEIGTRIHHHLRALTKARARRDGRDTASAEDIEAISSYVNFFSSSGQLL